MQKISVTAGSSLLAHSRHWLEGSFQMWLQMYLLQTWIHLQKHHCSFCYSWTLVCLLHGIPRDLYRWVTTKPPALPGTLHPPSHPAVFFQILQHTLLLWTPGPLHNLHQLSPGQYPFCRFQLQDHFLFYEPLLTPNSLCDLLSLTILCNRKQANRYLNVIWWQVTCSTMLWVPCGQEPGLVLLINYSLAPRMAPGKWQPAPLR